MLLPTVILLALVDYLFHQSEEECLCSCNYAGKDPGPYTCIPPIEGSSECPSGNCEPKTCSDLFSDSPISYHSYISKGIFCIIGLFLGHLISNIVCVTGLYYYIMIILMLVVSLVTFRLLDGDGTFIPSLVSSNPLPVHSECKLPDPVAQSSCCQDKCVASVAGGTGTLMSGIDTVFECGSEIVTLWFKIVLGIIILGIMSSCIGGVRDCSIKKSIDPGSVKGMMRGAGDIRSKMKGAYSRTDPGIGSGSYILLVLVVLIGLGIGLNGVIPIMGAITDITDVIWQRTGLQLLRNMPGADADADADADTCAESDPSLATCSALKCRYSTLHGPARCEECNAVYTPDSPGETALSKIAHNPTAIVAMCAGIYASKKILSPVFRRIIELDTRMMLKMTRRSVAFMSIKIEQLLSGKLARKLEGIIARRLEELAIRETESAAARTALDGSIAVAEAGVAVATGGLAILIEAPIDGIMMAGMAADIVDDSAFRSYMSNEEDIIIKRDAIDGSYMQAIFGQGVDGNIVPPNQTPPIYPLSLLVDPFQNTQLDEAEPFKIIGQAFMEAMTSYTIHLIDLIGHGTASSDLLSKYQAYKTISGSTVYEQSSTWCDHEAEIEAVYAVMINYNPTERDTHVYDYIQKYMENGAISASEYYGDISRSENIWERALTVNSVHIITRGLKHGQSPLLEGQWRYMDLINNYGSGTDIICGVSLSEAGCILLNQILNWESHLWFPDLLDITLDIPPTDVSQINAIKKKPSALPKVTYSGFHRKITNINTTDTDTTFTLLTLPNPTSGSDGSFLPLFYPSHSFVETLCQLGYGGLKIISGETTGISALDLFARGDGFSHGSTDQEPWAPILYGSSYDDKMGVCRYETNVGKLTNPHNPRSENYCVRMGRTEIDHHKKERTNIPASEVYSLCDNECDGGCEFLRFTIGEEFQHGYDRVNISNVISRTESHVSAWWDSNPFS